MAQTGVAEIIDLHITPWGNSYCETSLCVSPTPGTYDPNVRQCWDSSCNSTSSDVPEECYSCTTGMQNICQHGEEECTGNRMEACILHYYPDMSDYFPFFSCFEGRFGGKMDFAQECAAKTGIDYSKMMGCVKSSLGDSLDLEHAKTTTTAYHAGCPWVMIDGVVCPDTDNVLSYICAAYTGVKPAGCK